ncbi:hypothetical protein pb186bvf_011862 [Paramecium bursaria]
MINLQNISQQLHNQLEQAHQISEKTLRERDFQFQKSYNQIGKSFLDQLRDLDDKPFYFDDEIEQEQQYINIEQPRFRDVMLFIQGKAILKQPPEHEVIWEKIKKMFNLDLGPLDKSLVFIEQNAEMFKGYLNGTKLAPILNNLQSINNQFDQQKTLINNLSYNVSKIQIETKNKEQDQKQLQWLYSLQQRESQLTEEIKSNEQKKVQVEQLKEQVLFLQDQVDSLTKENLGLRKHLDQLQSKNEQLVSQQDIAIKQAIKEISEQFIIRLTNLESQLQTKQKEDFEYNTKLNQLNNQMKVLQQQKIILQEECDKFEIIKETLDKEKQMYLNEFRYLKENYIKTIDKLQDEVHRLKVENHTLSDEHKSYKETMEYYKKRFQDMMDIHELAQLNSDTSLLNVLKSRGMQGVTEADIQQVRTEIIGDNMIKRQYQFSSAWDQVFNDISNIN